MKKVLFKEIRTLSLPSDPFEACLLGTSRKGVNAHPDDEREVQTRILHMAQPYLPRQQPKEFLGSNGTFPFIVSAKFDGTQIAKLLSVLR